MTACFKGVEKLFPGKPVFNCNSKLTSIIKAPRRETVSCSVWWDWVGWMWSLWKIYFDCFLSFFVVFITHTFILQRKQYDGCAFNFQIILNTASLKMQLFLNSAFGSLFLSALCTHFQLNSSIYYLLTADCKMNGVWLTWTGWNVVILLHAYLKQANKQYTLYAVCGMCDIF